MGVKLDIFVDFQVIVYTEEVWHVPDPRTRLRRMPQDIDADYFRITIIGYQQRGQRADGGGLAGSVLADEAVDCTARYVQIEVVHRVQPPTVALGEPARPNHCATSPMIVSSGAW